MVTSVTEDLQRSMAEETTKTLEALKEMQAEDKAFLKEMQQEDQKFLRDLFAASQTVSTLAHNQPNSQGLYYVVGRPRPN